jgi:predicted dehydrogenase
MKKLKVGLVGCGFISDRHLQAWAKMKDAEVVSVCDIRQENAVRKAKKYNIRKVYNNLEEMFDKEDMDLVDITTPKESHMDIVTKAANHSLHVLCQKPMAPTLQEAEKMIKVCKEKKIKFMIHQNFRWTSHVQKIRQLLDIGQVGPIFYANITQRIAHSIPIGVNREIPFLQTQPFMRELDQMILFEMALHYVDLMRFFLGEPTSIYAQTRKIGGHAKGEDLVAMIMDFGGVLAIIEDSWCSQGTGFSTRIRIEGRNGTIYVDTEGGELKLYQDTQEMTMNVDRNADSFLAVQQHFVECIRENKAPQTSGEDNIRSLKVVFSAYESACKNCVVVL